MMKRCTKCGEWKPTTAEYYGRDRSKKDGLSSACKACRAKYHEAKKEQVHDQQRLYRQKNGEKIRQQQRLYRQKNGEKTRARIRRWREEHLDWVHERDRHYHQENLEERRDNNRRRRAQKIDAPGTHTTEDIERQIQSQTDSKGVLHCWWCGKPIEDQYHVDHRIPLSKGGNDDPGNLVIAHPKCNQSKHDKLPHEWNGRLL